MTTADHRDAETLRELYHDKGLTQTEIAEKFNVDDSVISRTFNEHDIEVIYNRSRRKDEHKDADTLRELYHEKRLTQDEIGKKFGVSGTTIQRWMADLDVKTQRPRKEDVVRDIQQVAETLGRKPRQSDMRDHGEYGMNMGQRRLGSWNNALRAAGFEPKDWKGENNPAWNGGYEKYYGPNWQEQRLKAVIRDQARCQDCGMSEAESMDWFEYKLDVHHLTPIKEFKENGEIDYTQANQIESLIALCRSCHSERESST